mmetsp:Transcript_95517/g.154069  ORF Transcript_95517/g.154069 Transcript_95517/m.154069 type:complete len:629 (+) Transcript_95517:53-1939(+)
MSNFFDFLPVPPGMFSDPPPKKPDPDNYTPEERARQAEEIKGDGKGGDMTEGEPKPESVQPEPPARSQMQKPLAPIEAGVEECDLCGRWKSKCRICAALFCEQCSMGEAIRMSHVRRGTVICGQCTVMMDKVPSARIVPPSIPDVNLGPSLSSEKSWKMDILRGAMTMPTRPPPAIFLLTARGQDKEFSPEDLDNDFKYQNLFEVLFSPDLHLLSAMFEVMPDDDQGDELLAAILRLVDRSARNEQIMKACVEMEVANTLDASTMFRRNNMSLRILKMHLTKVGAVFLKDTLRPVLLKFRDAVDQRRARGCSLEIDPNLITPNDNLLNNVNDLTMHASLVFEEIKKKVPKGLGKNMESIFTQLRLLSEARFPNSGHRVVASLFISRFIIPALLQPHQDGLLDSPPDTFLARSLKLLTDTIRNLALAEKFPDGSPMHSMNSFIEQKKREMKNMLAAMSDAKDDAWDHHNPKQVVVYSKDVPDVLRLIVNKMEIIERHAYLQEQQHEELRGSFLRLRAAVADLTYSASYSSGVGSRYGAAPAAPMPYETDEGDWDGQAFNGGGAAVWNSAAEAAMMGGATPPLSGNNGDFNQTVTSTGYAVPRADPPMDPFPAALSEGMIPPSNREPVAM